MLLTCPGGNGGVDRASLLMLEVRGLSPAPSENTTFSPESQVQWLLGAAAPLTWIGNVPRVNQKENTNDFHAQFVVSRLMKEQLATIEKQKFFNMKTSLPLLSGLLRLTFWVKKMIAVPLEQRLYLEEGGHSDYIVKTTWKLKMPKIVFIDFPFFPFPDCQIHLFKSAWQFSVFGVLVETF